MQVMPNIDASSVSPNFNFSYLCFQVRSIMGQVRPDRQTLLFTATMPNKVNNLVSDCLTTPVRVTVGEIGAANQDIQQARLLQFYVLHNLYFRMFHHHLSTFVFTAGRLGQAIRTSNR